MSDQKISHTDEVEPLHQGLSVNFSKSHYEEMDFEKLLIAFKKLLKKNQVDQVKQEANVIRSVFHEKHQDLFEKRKQEHISSGGSEFDFSYILPVKVEFEAFYDGYRKQLKKYYKDLENELKENYKKRLDLIEDLKNLINTEENINTTFKRFLELQRQWRSIGHIPKIYLDDVWKTYHHHIEKFYDYLDLNRDLRDKEFAYNLEQKRKLIVQAKALSEEQDLQKAFREVRVLRKVWREDVGPVAKDYREDIWKAFNEALDVVYQKKTLYLENLKKIQEENLKIKEALLQKMQDIANEKELSISEWSKKSKEMRVLREDFLKVGSSPTEKTKELWKRFKFMGRQYATRRKILFDKIKEEEQTNLKKRQDIIAQVEDLKESSAFDTATPQMIQLQKDWKTIGRVSIKHSEKTWKIFKSTCDYYFERVHSQKDKQLLEQQQQSLESKKNLLKSLQDYTLQDDQKADKSFVKDVLSQWTSLAKIPKDARGIESDFNDALEKFIKRINLTDKDLEGIRYDMKLSKMSIQSPDKLKKEQQIINKNITSMTLDMQQLENNASFINTNADSPLLVEINKRIEDFSKKIELLNLKKNKLTALFRRLEKPQ